MAKKLTKLDLLKLSSIDTASEDFIAFAAKSDGLYQKIGQEENKIATTKELSDKVKTDVPEDAKFTDTVYEHPDEHPADIIIETELKKFVSDAEKAEWNAKETVEDSTAKASSALTDAKAYVDSKVLTDVPEGAVFTDTKYTHPSTHPASIIKQDADNRFVTEEEKDTWNAKETTAGATSKANQALEDAIEYVNDKVQTNVPEGAIFTDTTYDAMSPVELMAGTVDVSRVVSAKNLNDWLGSKNYISSYIDTKYTAGQGLTLTGTVFTPDFGTGAGKVVQGDDTRLSDARTPLAHNQAISTITGLQSALDGKVNNSQVLTDVPSGAKFTDTVTTVNGKTGVITKADIVALGIPEQDTVYTHPAGTNPHGTTKADVGLGNADNTSDVNKPVSTAQQTAINLGVAEAKTHADEKSVLAIPLTQKGSASGVAELDAEGIILSSQLPSYVDDVLEFATLANFPTTGESGKIYVATNTNLTYRWTGTTYVEISPSIALGETSATAYRGDRGKIAYDHSQVAHAPSNAQKNSDITKAEIEAKLTGAITTHTHSAYVPTSRTVAGKALTGNITLAKEDVGLSNVDNTSDANKPVSTAQENAISEKVDKVTGKGLSTNDYTTVEKNKLSGIEAGANNYVHPETHSAEIITETDDKKFVTDAEKAEWNSKETISGSQAKANEALEGAKAHVDSKVLTDVPKDAVFTDTVYTHPDKHDASIIEQDATNRFVTDKQIGEWTAKETTIGAQSKVDIALGSAKAYVDGKVLTDVPANAIFTDTVYTHPETHPASIILQNSSNRFVSDAEKLAWNDKVDNSRVLTDVPENAKFTDTTYDVATTSTNGLMSSIDKQNLNANTTSRHTHNNKSVLDKFTEVDNKPYYNGEEMGGGTSAIIKSEEIISTEGQTVFTLTKGNYAPNENKLAIYIWGIKQHSNAFIETSTTSFTLSSGLKSGDRVIAEWFETSQSIKGDKGDRGEKGDPGVAVDIGTGISITSEDLVLEGTYIAAGGTLGNSSVSNASNLIPCKDASYVSLIFQTLDTTSIYFGFAFYDESEQFIVRIGAELDPSGVRGGRERTLQIPSNAHYLRCQYWNEEKRIEYDAPEFYLTVDGTNILSKKIAEISSGLKPLYTQEDLTIKEMYVKYRDDRVPEAIGTVRSSTSSDCTGFLRCNNFSNLTLMQPGWTDGFAGVGFYNKDFELFSYVVNRSRAANTAYETTIEVPENAYYFRTSYWDKEAIEEYNLPEFYVIAGTLAENINELYSRVITTSLGGSYIVSYTAEKIIVTNVATNGSTTFDLIGSDTLSGNFTYNEVLKGGKLIRKVEDEFKVMNVTFDLMSDSAPLQIYTHTTYKVDTEIENDGIEGICSGDMGFLKDENVLVEGNPMIAGFTDEAKTKFALCADYGSMTPHYDKVEEVEYTGIDVVKGERKFAKLSVLKEESPLRLLNQPNGYNATFTFASHVDRTTVPVAKAIFYGTDNEASPTYNTNGLLSYGIKGTMSMFAEGHTSVHAALDNAPFKALIDDAYSKGIEIIPHTLTYDPDTRAGAERMLPFFKENYNSRNWIDHYLRQDNPSIGHHSKGNDPESPYYIMDLMEQYGYDYSWCYIDTTPDGVVRNQLFEEHYQFRRDLLFKNKKLTFPDGTPMWQYKNTWKMFETIIGNGAYDEIEHIQNLIDTCNVWADHPYLTATYGQLWKKIGSETVIDPKFDSMLSFVKDKKEAGEIWNPTQSEYNDNLAKLMDISIVRSGVGQYKVFSKNEESVNCSFLLKNTFKDVYLNGVLAESKVSGDNMIFWGDIKQGENTIIVS